MNCRDNDVGCASLPLPPHDKNFNGLQGMVEWYIKNRKQNLFAGISQFKTLYDLIAGGTSNPKRLESRIGKDVVKYKKGSHQRHLTNIVINNVHDTYNGKVNPKDFSDFDDYVDFVRSLKVQGFGETCIYDFCVISGYAHGLMPEKKVYIHTGPWISFKALAKMGLIDTKIRDSRIDHSSLPKEIRVLESPYAEDFLCVFHSHLEKMAKEQQTKKITSK